MNDHEPGDLARMSTAELAELGHSLDEIEIRTKTEKFPGATGQPAKKAARRVGSWFVGSAFFGLMFLVTYIAWPQGYVAPGFPKHTLYLLYNAVVGCSFGLSVLLLGMGLVAYVKTFVPAETAVMAQEPPSTLQARATAVAVLSEDAADVGLAQRPVLRRTALGAGGLFGLGCGFLAIGGFIHDPNKGGTAAALRFTAWKSLSGETVYLRGFTGVLGEIYKVRPEDMAPGSMQTVFPYRDSDAGHAAELLEAQRSGDTPVMLFRLFPDTPVKKAPGQENFNYGDYYAFSKICTHLGCPASQWDHQNNKSLCPCHQSEFLITEYARPVFGPATTPLPQLPITVNDEGYFVATGDFNKPVGPEFWEEHT